MRGSPTPHEEGDVLYPTVYDGRDGVRFVHQSLASHAADAAWQPLR